MTRRSFVTSATAAGSMFAAAPPFRSRMGVATTAFLGFRRPKDTYEFLDYSYGLGASGIQAPLASLEPAYIERLNERAKSLGMWIEVMAGLPRTHAEVDRFSATLAAAKNLGSTCVRSACLSGRRYENFDSLPLWQSFVADSHAALARALRVAEKQQVALAIENHKDWTADEMVTLLKRYDSPWMGVCLDTGNNMSLLDDPADLMRKLLPYVKTVHIKDMGVARMPEGFLLSEVVFGDGILDIPGIVASVPPGVKVVLEMITRDPLRVPCLTNRYWATFPDRHGLFLARTLRMVEEKQTKLPVVSHLSREEQLKVEEQNVVDCLKKFA